MLVFLLFSAQPFSLDGRSIERYYALRTFAYWFNAVTKIQAIIII